MILTREPGWLVSEVGEEILMLNIDRGEYVGLNSSGAAIWEILETPHTSEDLVDRLLVAFEVERAQANEDVQAFVEMALSRGILKVEPEGL